MSDGGPVEGFLSLPYPYANYFCAVPPWHDHVQTFNQGMMELGATVCPPRAPLCLGCPWQPWCRTRGEHPVRRRGASNSSRTAAMARNNRYG